MSDETGVRVSFVVTGYPSKERPTSGVFTHRTIKALGNHIIPSVIHIRSMRPGRSISSREVWDGVSVLRVAVPQIPQGWARSFNLRLMVQFLGVGVRDQMLKSDLVHSTGLLPVSYAVSRIIRSAIPHVGQAIGDDVNIFLPRLANRIGSDWLGTLSAVICNSNNLAQSLKNIAPTLSHIEVIHRGVDCNQFSPNTSPLGPLAGRASFKFLYLGGFQTWQIGREDVENTKGGHVLLRAWKMAEAQLQGACLAIGGPGCSSSHLDQWRSGLQRPEDVSVIGTILPSEVAGYLSSCDCVVIPSLNEGLPNLANEALACARPVLGSDAGGIPEVVEHGRTGVIVKRGDPQALSEAMISLMRARNSVSAMGQEGRFYVQSERSWEACAYRMHAVFKSSIERSTGCNHSSTGRP